MTIVLAVLQMSLPGCNGDKTSPKNEDKIETTVTEDRFAGLCYGPHRDNQDPGLGIQPSVSDISEDLTLIKNLTRKIRTYGVSGNLEQIPMLCEQNGIDCYPGAWISPFPEGNEQQITSLLSIAKQNLPHVKGLIVGNEVLLRNDVSEEKLIGYISGVKDSTNVPVATAETWKDWLEHPQLAQAVDIMLVHIYPYWDGIAIESSADYLLEKWNEVKAKYANKTMILGETGWPSQGQVQGNAIASEENQRAYVSALMRVAKAHKIDYFYFEVFDEEWKKKAEGEAGAHWGIYQSNGSAKARLMDLIPESARAGISRLPQINEAH